MVVTSATIAAVMARWMATNKVPFPADMPVQSEDPMLANDLVQTCWDWDQNPRFTDMPAWDKDSTPGNTTDVVQDNAIATELVGIGFLVQQGASLDDIISAVNTDNYITLNTLYASLLGRDPANMWDDMVVASEQLATQFAPTNAKMQDDFFGVFGVVYPS
jgi:hypothetical protein